MFWVAYPPTAKQPTKFREAPHLGLINIVQGAPRCAEEAVLVWGWGVTGLVSAHQASTWHLGYVWITDVSDNWQQCGQDGYGTLSPSSIWPHLLLPKKQAAPIHLQTKSACSLSYFLPLQWDISVSIATDWVQITPGLVLGQRIRVQFCLAGMPVDPVSLFERTTFCRRSNFSFSWHPRQSSLSTHQQHISSQDFFNEIAGNLPSRLGPVN